MLMLTCIFLFLFLRSAFCQMIWYRPLRSNNCVMRIILLVFYISTGHLQDLSFRLRMWSRRPSESLFCMISSYIHLPRYQVSSLELSPHFSTWWSTRDTQKQSIQRRVPNMMPKVTEGSLMSFDAMAAGCEARFDGIDAKLLVRCVVANGNNAQNNTE